MNRGRAFLPRLMSLLLFLGAWQAAAWLIGTELILPGPLRVARTAAALLPRPEFRAAAAGTFLRGTAAFLLSALLGTAAGLLSGRSRIIRLLLAPWMTVIRSTPVLSIILLAIIWFQTPRVPVFVAFLVGFPIVAENVRAGVTRTDSSLREMARVFLVSRRDQILRLYLPSALPYMLAGFSTALGITWKAVVAAEVLSMPARGLGTGMQIARSQLETAEVFAWTVAAVVLAGLTEGLLALARRRLPNGE